MVHGRRTTAVSGVLGVLILSGVLGGSYPCRSAEVGELIPFAVVDLAGGIVGSSSLQGRQALLMFGATW